MSIAQVLGDNGTAIEHARTVAPGAIPTAERRGRYWVDVASGPGAPPAPWVCEYCRTPSAVGQAKQPGRVKLQDFLPDLGLDR